MSIFRGTYWGRTFRFSDNNKQPVDITGWEFRAHLRSYPSEPNPADFELTTANSGFVVTNGPEGLLLMQIVADDTLTLEVGKAVFDVLRTDVEPGPLWLFAAYTHVREPITHD